MDSLSEIQYKIILNSQTDTKFSRSGSRKWKNWKLYVKIISVIVYKSHQAQVSRYLSLDIAFACNKHQTLKHRKHWNFKQKKSVAIKNENHLMFINVQKNCVFVIVMMSTWSSAQWLIIANILYSSWILRYKGKAL